MTDNTLTIDQKRTFFNKIGYEPHSPAQWSIHQSSARFRVPCCGRRWGKSQAAGHELSAHLTIPNTYWWIVGPTYPLGEKEFRVIWEDWTMKLGLRHKLKVSYNPKQGDMSIRFPWNTVLEVKSAEKQDSLVGEGLDGVIMSEAALHKASTWEMYIEPSLSDKRGWAIFPSTPRGFNWFKGLYDLGQEPEMTDYQSWRHPTWTNLARYPGGYDDPEMVRTRAVASEYHWLQEYAAEFTAFEGKIYPDFNQDHHVRRIEYNPAWLNYLAFDFGWAAPFVCLDIMVDPSDNVYVWREYQVRHRTTYEHGQLLRSRANPRGYHVSGMFADPHGADEIATLRLLLGHIEAPVVPWSHGVEAITRWLKLQPDGKPKLFIAPECTELIRQMEMLRAIDEKEGKNPKEGQHDYDDHGPDALRYFFAGKYVLGIGAHLSDVYSKRRERSEATTFFQSRTQTTFKRDELIPFG